MDLKNYKKYLPIYIDCSKNYVLGRLCSKIINLLKTNKVIIYNIEKIIVSGSIEDVSNYYLGKINRGKVHGGPFYPKSIINIFKRVIRGMVPFYRKRSKSLDIISRLKVLDKNLILKEGIFEKYGFKEEIGKIPSKYFTLKDLINKINKAKK